MKDGKDREETKKVVTHKFRSRGWNVKKKKILLHVCGERGKGFYLLFLSFFFPSFLLLHKRGLLLLP